MLKKILWIFICTLMIATTLTATGAINFQTKWLINENNNIQSYQNAPIDSPNLIAINIIAKVVSVDDSHNLLGGTIKVNDTIKGKYIYDSNATDINADPNIGVYWCNFSTCGIEVKAGGFVFKTDPNDVEFAIAIGNDLVNPNGDLYEVISFSNLNLSNGLVVYGLEWFLYDPTGTALSDDVLPTTAPVLSKWNQSASGYGLTLAGYNPTNFSAFTIRADVTKVAKSRAKDTYYTTQPILIRLLERFPKIFPILRHLMKP